MDRIGISRELVRFWIALQRHRFAILLVSLIALFVSVAIVYMFHSPGQRFLAGLTVAILFDLMLISAINAVCRTRRTVITAVSLAAPAILFNLIHATTQYTPACVAGHLLSIALITLVIILVLGFLFRTERVDLNMICASLCIYLLIGVAWSSLYSLCELAHPGSFIYAYADRLENPAMAFGAEKSLIPVYYSFVTLTTLGYGDIVPFSPPAKILAVLEAVLGQIYLTVLVARLVGLHIVHVTTRKSAQGTGGETRSPATKKP